MDGLTKALENRTARLFAAVSLLIVILCTAVSAVVCHEENRSAQVQAVQYTLGVAGRMSETGKLTSDEIADILLADSSDDSISAGEKILGSFGLKSGENLGGDYVVRSEYGTVFCGLICGLLVTVAGIMALSTVYRRVRNITQLTERSEENFPEDSDRDFLLLQTAVGNLIRQTDYLLGKIKEEKEYLITYLQDFSHQIKTPCTGLMLNNGILRSSPMDFSKQKSFFDADRSCLERINRLCTESLKLARLDSGVVEYSMDRQSLGQMCKRISAELKPIADRNSDEIICTVPEEISLECDGVWLSEAVSNLVKNAAEHTHNGTVKLYAEENPTAVNLYIEDNGEGISPNDLPYVFRRFYSKSAEKNPTSAGIGMSAARKITEDMGGKIYIDSEINKGTKIRIEFLL